MREIVQKKKRKGCSKEFKDNVTAMFWKLKF